MSNRGGLNEVAKEPYRRNARLARFATHLIVLVIVFVMPEVLLSWGRTMPKFVYVHTLGYIIVFYLNYYLLIDKYLFRRKRIWLYFIINLFFVVSYLFLIFGVHYLCYPPEMPPDAGKGMFPYNHALTEKEWVIRGLQGMFSRDFLMMVLSICISIALKLSEKWLKWEQYEQKMAVERKEIELKNLKNQLNPHFLFNTLNNIYALIGISQERAQYAVHELSQLLRYVLYENDSKTVPLDKDMLFVKNYIELMRLRLGDNTTLKVSIDERQGVGLQIAPLMFISLVENAFKHGVSGSQKSVIDIGIKVEGSKVVCRVANSCFPKDGNDRSGSGIGIANLKRQLSILYNGRYQLSQQQEADGSLYVANLEIDLQENK